MDADERASEALGQAIKTLLGTTPPKVGYAVKRHNHFMGRRIKYSGWQGDWVLRLAHKKQCRYQETQVHEALECAGATGKLKGHLNHYTYKSLTHYLAKFEDIPPAQPKTGPPVPPALPCTIWPLNPPSAFLNSMW